MRHSGCIDLPMYRDVRMLPCNNSCVKMQQFPDFFIKAHSSVQNHPDNY